MSSKQTRLDEDDFGLIGRSPAIEEVRSLIRKLTKSVSPVLITGESGVGKELVARALHKRSPLASQTFLPVDSASLVGSLMESELFGYVKGAFTGALESKQGLIRAAEGGTLFLDEIGELAPEIQAKLLRLLQEGEVRPIGAVKPIRVDVRILAATNRDLEAEVKALRFRKDLFYRLNVIRIEVPPLRERPEDIPLLIDHFMQRYALHEVRISPHAREAFESYNWPGNVRELENCVRRLVALKSDPLIDLQDLPSPLRNASETGRQFEADHMLPLAEVERRHILRVLDYTQGDTHAAALMLGIGRTTLYRRIKEYRRHMDKEEMPDYFPQTYSVH